MPDYQQKYISLDTTESQEGLLSNQEDVEISETNGASNHCRQTQRALARWSFLLSVWTITNIALSVFIIYTNSLPTSSGLYQNHKNALLKQVSSYCMYHDNHKNLANTMSQPQFLIVSIYPFRSCR